MVWHWCIVRRYFYASYALLLTRDSHIIATGLVFESLGFYIPNKLIERVWFFCLNHCSILTTTTSFEEKKNIFFHMFLIIITNFDLLKKKSFESFWTMSDYSMVSNNSFFWKQSYYYLTMCSKRTRY